MHWKFYNILSLPYTYYRYLQRKNNSTSSYMERREKKFYNFWFACLESVEAGKLLLWNLWVRFTFHTLIIIYTKTYFCTEMYDRYGSLLFHFILFAEYYKLDVLWIWMILWLFRFIWWFQIDNNFIAYSMFKSKWNLFSFFHAIVSVTFCKHILKARIFLLAKMRWNSTVVGPIYLKRHEHNMSSKAQQLTVVYPPNLLMERKTEL